MVVLAHTNSKGDIALGHDYIPIWENGELKMYLKSICD
jgi:hypothetical protein